MAEDRKTPDMAGLMESAFMMGIGFMELSREKAKDLSDELIDRGRMSQSDAKRVAERVTEAAGQQQDAVRTMVAEETKRAMQSAGVATHDEIAELRREIEELKTLIATSRTAAGD